MAIAEKSAPDHQSRVDAIAMAWMRDKDGLLERLDFMARTVRNYSDEFVDGNDLRMAALCLCLSDVLSVVGVIVHETCPETDETPRATPKRKGTK